MSDEDFEKQRLQITSSLLEASKQNTRSYLLEVKPSNSTGKSKSESFYQGGSKESKSRS